MLREPYFFSKKNLFYIASFLLATAITGCSNDENENLVQSDFSVEAGIAFQKSRTTLLEDNSVVWSKNDQIYLFGDNSKANLNLVKGEGESTGTFSGHVYGFPSQLKYALYPLPAINGETYSYEFPSELTYSENSNAPMLGDFNLSNIQFENLSSMVRIKLINLDDSKENVVKLTMKGITGIGTVDLETRKLMFPEAGMGDEVIVKIPAGIKECFVDIPVPAKKYSGYQVELNGNLIASKTSEKELSVDEVAIVAPCEIDNEDVKFPESENGEYVIMNLTELILFAQEVNGGRNFSKETVKLGADIDLGGLNWTPIGNSSNKFEGIFDGQNHIISNLTIKNKNKSNMGLFGFTTNGEIKNLIVNNANVAGRLNVGVIAGTPYTSKYTNIKINGHVEVNGMSYVGAVGGKNAYANWNDIVVSVDPTSYVNANSVENGTAYRTYVGGVVGFNGEGNHTFKNIQSNIDVKGSTCDVGGLFGIAHYGNNFENCICTGDVEIYNASAAGDAEEMGGIAGVWHNEDGHTVIFNACSFSGTLKSNITEGVDLSNNTIVGAAYKSTGKGKLFIDGYLVVFNADDLVAALEDKQNSMFANDIKIDPANMSNAYGTTGINIKNGQSIDGNGKTLNIKGAGGTWDSGINTTGGLIKNITVTGSFRGIFINHNSTHSEQVILENVIIDGTVYTISCDQGLNQTLKATSSTFNGWTSYAATLGSAEFVGCNFGESNGYAYCRPYAPTSFKNCNFKEGYTIDPRATVTFENCTLNGVAVTSENISTLVSSTEKVTVL